MQRNEQEKKLRSYLGEVVVGGGPLFSPISDVAHIPAPTNTARTAAKMMAIVLKPLAPRFVGIDDLRSGSMSSSCVGV